MYSYKESREVINHYIKKIDLPDNPAELYDPIRYVLSNDGKRFRPSLVLMVCELFSRTIEDAIMPAIGIEIFHNFTLLHDDIMDESRLRRNKPTVHEKWNENIAILAGDVMSFLSHSYISKCNKSKLTDVIDLFNQTAIMVCEGQQFDMNYESYKTVSVKDYLHMIKLKTSVLIAASSKLGALLGNANKKDTGLMYDFGLNLGMAFQIQDDLLDAYGDIETFGKQPGSDITANKKTYLLIKALEIASPKQKTMILNVLNNKEFNPEEKIKTFLSIYDDLNIKKITEQEINKYFSRSKDFLNKVSVSENKKEQLTALFEIITKRDK